MKRLWLRIHVTFSRVARSLMCRSETKRKESLRGRWGENIILRLFGALFIRFSPSFFKNWLLLLLCRTIRALEIQGSWMLKEHIILEGSVKLYLQQKNGKSSWDVTNRNRKDPKEIQSEFLSIYLKLYNLEYMYPRFHSYVHPLETLCDQWIDFLGGA